MCTESRDCLFDNTGLILTCTAHLQWYRLPCRIYKSTLQSSIKIQLEHLIRGPQMPKSICKLSSGTQLVPPIGQGHAIYWLHQVQGQGFRSQIQRDGNLRIAFKGADESGFPMSMSCWFSTTRRSITILLRIVNGGETK